MRRIKRTFIWIRIVESTLGANNMYNCLWYELLLVVMVLNIWTYLYMNSSHWLHFSENCFNHRINLNNDQIKISKYSIVVVLERMSGRLDGIFIFFLLFLHQHHLHSIEFPHKCIRKWVERIWRRSKFSHAAIYFESSRFDWRLVLVVVVDFYNSIKSNKIFKLISVVLMCDRKIPNVFFLSCRVFPRMDMVKVARFHWKSNGFFVIAVAASFI